MYSKFRNNCAMIVYVIKVDFIPPGNDQRCYLSDVFIIFPNNLAIALFRFRTGNPANCQWKPGSGAEWNFTASLCSLCTLNEVGDENHYTEKCSFFNVETSEIFTWTI